MVGATSGSTAHLFARINELESHMLDGKLVHVGDDGKSLKPCKSTLPSSKKVVDPDSDDEVLEIYNDSATYMAYTSFKVNEICKKVVVEWAGRVKQLKEETYDEDLYDDNEFDDCGLTKSQMEFAKCF